MPRPKAPSFLALDAGSHPVSVAAGGLEQQRTATLAVGESSSALLDTVDSVLTDSGLTLSDIDGVLCTAGPGSFTGLRIAMATILGLNASRQIPAVALPTLWVQAAAAQISNPSDSTTEAWLSVVPAHRNQHYVQQFDAAGLRTRGPIATVRDLKQYVQTACAPTQLLTSAPSSLPALSDCSVIDTGLLATSLVQLAGKNAQLAKSPREASLFDWDATTLTKPLYAHSPAVSARPRARAGFRS